MDVIAEALAQVQEAFRSECPDPPPGIGGMTASYIEWLIKDDRRI
jgi:hypothetical protein